MKSFVGITGTTCVGKSKVGVLLAKMLNTEVISADSMQIYKDMTIGTAKISCDEMQGVKHHMIDIVRPDETFSSFDYQQAASKLIDEMTTLPLVVGGTGFYFDSLLYPPEFGGGDKVRRRQLQTEMQTYGLEYLCNKLKLLDEETYKKIDLKNPVRVIRALEIAEAGEKKSTGKGKNKEPKYNCKLYVLQRDRQSLYKMIDERVDEMVRQGLFEEVSQLVKTYGVCDTSAFSAIGYKEIIEHFRGKISAEQAIENIKTNTRRYAKRQITYFKKLNVYKYIDVNDKTAEDIAKNILENCKFDM